MGPPRLFSHRISPRALEQIKGKLQELSDHIENVEQMEHTKEGPDLINGIRDTIVDCQVSRAQTVSAI